MHRHVVTVDEGGRVWEGEVSILRTLVLSWPPQPQPLTSSLQELPPCGLIIEGEEVMACLTASSH